VTGAPRRDGYGHPWTCRRTLALPAVVWRRRMLANWRSLTPSVGKQETGGWVVCSDCLRLRVHRPIGAPYLTDYLGHPAV
jgi:hypothetical protein